MLSSEAITRAVTRSRKCLKLGKLNVSRPTKKRKKQGSFTEWAQRSATQINQTLLDAVLHTVVKYMPTSPERRQFLFPSGCLPSDDLWQVVPVRLPSFRRAAI